jgi:hypothetical protein
MARPTSFGRFFGAVSLLQSIAQVLAFLVAYYVVRYVFSHSEHADAYGVLCAWWAVLYTGLLTRASMKSLPALAVLTFLLSTAMAMTGIGPLAGHEQRDAGLYSIFSSLLAGAVMLLLPAILNVAAQAARDGLLRMRGK